MEQICNLSLLDVASKLRSRELGVVETVKACLNQIEKTEPMVDALLAQNAEVALQEAKSMDNDGPNAQQPLWGVPIVIKDAISTKNLRTTAASRILEDFIPIYDAHVVAKLREAGAVILAKANMDEFAMGSSTENSAFKKTKNPWDLQKTPGGSSGGSAATVAARQCFGSLGSDTGGSIRQPAAFCGCVGIKPTYGRVSRFGLFAFASSMDQIGPITKNVEDGALLLSIIAGHDSRDNTSVDRPDEDYLAQLKAVDKKSAPLSSFKLGVPENFFNHGLSTEVKDACRANLNLAQSLGAELVSVTLPDPDVASAVYYVLAMAEASSNLARYDGVKYGKRAAGVANLDELYLKSRSQGFGQEVKRRIMLGSYVLSAGYYDAYFKKAAQVRRQIYDQYIAALDKCDAILMPVAPVTAWLLGAHELDPLKAYLMDAFTLPANLAGLPAVSLPVGLGHESNMPIGMQIVGKHFQEAKILEIAYMLENAIPKLGAPTALKELLT